MPRSALTVELEHDIRPRARSRRLSPVTIAAGAEQVELHLHGYQGGNADAHGVGQRLDFGHAAGDRGSGGGQSTGLRHRLADPLRRGCLQPDHGRVGGPYGNLVDATSAPDGQLEHDVHVGTFTPAVAG